MAAPGPNVGPYRLEAPMARGGLSEVWLARGADGSRVAVKRALDAKDLTALEALERERDIGRRLHHPAIVGVLDAGNDASGPYVVFEYIDGPSLRERLGQGPLGEAECVSMGAAILDALAVAHAEGVVHNDLKPENILLGLNGPKLTDFGAAQTFTETVSAERARELAATIAYLAPEVLAGADPSPASDLYSLGLTLYEAVAGRLPFAGSAAASAGQRMAAGVPPLRRFVPEVTPQLERTLARALDPDPGLRYSDAAAFAAQLTLKHEPTVVIPRAAASSPPAAPPASRPGRNGGRAGLAVAGFSALVLLGTAAALAGSGDGAGDDSADGPVFDAQARLALNVTEPTPAEPTAQAPAPATADAGGGATRSRDAAEKRDDQPKERGKPEEKAKDKPDQNEKEDKDDDDD